MLITFQKTKDNIMSSNNDDDMGVVWFSYREYKKELREKFGVECPFCKQNRPKTNASILLPQQKCKVDKYIDPRPKLTDKDRELDGRYVVKSGA